jgi:integrase
MPRKKVPGYPDFIKVVRSRGKVYEYFDTGQTVAGKRIYKAMPPKSDRGYGGTYAALLAARTSRENAHDATTVRDVIRAYQRGDDFKNRVSEGTRSTYLIYLTRIEEEMGDAPLAEVEKGDVRKLMDKLSDTPGAANLTLTVLGRLMAFALERDWIKVDPTKAVKPYPKGDKEHEPWPEDLLEKALAEPSVRLATALLYYTGQRIGDVCKMRWSDIRDGYLYVKQEKTGKELDILLHGELRAILDSTPKDAMTILHGRYMRPMKVQTLRKYLQEFAAKHGEKVVPHGLRKNAVNALLEVGCSTGEVSAITGQSLKVVEHYAKRRNNRRMGTAAVLKWEGGTKRGNRKQLENGG